MDLDVNFRLVTPVHSRLSGHTDRNTIHEHQTTQNLWAQIELQLNCTVWPKEDKIENLLTIDLLELIECHNTNIRKKN